MSDAEILVDIRNHVALITLNRPAALNALSLTMVGELTTVLRRCADDAHVRAVMLRGAGEKAFCAGGDIRALYQSIKDLRSAHREFFAAEYALDYFLHTYPKPYVALLTGITMGGGMGLGQGSRLRIVGERTRIAMPEVGIGLFPDVGGSYFLPRLPGALGTYLALTGTSLGGADALYAGLADFYLPPVAVAALPEELTTLRWQEDWAGDIRAFIESRACSVVPPATLSPRRAAIDEHFSHSTVQAILESLDDEGRAEYVEWARQTALVMRGRSPTMLSVTIDQLRRGKTASLADCFRMELGMMQQCFVTSDFLEGVRAVIIDKDNAPRWNPAQLSEVTDASVDAFFQQRWTTREHPLFHLGRN